MMHTARRDRGTTSAPLPKRDGTAMRDAKLRKEIVDGFINLAMEVTYALLCRHDGTRVHARSVCGDRVAVELLLNEHGRERSSERELPLH